MKILFDADVPAPLRHRLPKHQVSTAQEMGWGMLKNGELLVQAETSGFDLLITGDKNLSYQQNLEGRRLAIVVLRIVQWKQLRQDTSAAAAAVERAKAGSYEVL